MSESIALIFKPAAPPLAALAPLLQGFSRIEVQEGYEHGDQIVVFDGDDHAYIQPYTQEELAVELLVEGWPPELVPERVSALVIHYHDAALAKRAIVALASRCRFLVDTGQREIFTSEAFVDRLRREPEWDWNRVPVDDVPPASRPIVVFPVGWSCP